MIGLKQPRQRTDRVAVLLSQRWQVKRRAERGDAARSASCEHGNLVGASRSRSQLFVHRSSFRLHPDMPATMATELERRWLAGTHPR